jgi:hypothetical protein
MPLPSMYQDHQHTITRYVSQPCTKECNKPTTCTIENINHVKQPVPHHVHKPCTKTCRKPCINHAPQVPNDASTMHHNPYHMTQPLSMYINTIPSINIVPYHMSTMYINNVHQHRVPTIYLNHLPYHSIIAYTMHHPRIYQASTIC